MAADILLIDKPKGITSFDVVEEVKKKLKADKVGHAGTLDPLATGLLILGINDGTKKLTDFIKLPKTYQADILLGEKRTTGDMEGEIVEEKEVGPEFDEHKARNVLGVMLMEHSLPVPVFSAVKQGGEPLYKKARRGEAVEAPVRTMVVTGVRFVALRREGIRVVVSAEFDVESGVYIRSLAEEFGRAAGYPAVLKELRRTKIGPFKIEEAKRLEELTA